MSTQLPSAAGLAPRVRFVGAPGFQTSLRRVVDRYFRMTGKSTHDNLRMYLKTTIVAVWTIASYVLLVFVADAWWQAVPLAISLGLATAAVGFNIQHDGSHGAYSRFGWVNRVMATTMDMVGASSFVWARKHNTLHHTYTNIDGRDDDIDVGFFARISPHQKRLAVHRFQHLYLWFLYALLPMKWQFVDDFYNVATGRISGSRMARPKGWDLVIFVTGKALFFFFALILPMLLHPFWAVIGLYALACFVQGVVISVVFQLAHVVEAASFPEPDPETGLIQASFAEHQISTTVDFARRNKLVSWFVGGLNFQVEHHLFPRICHVHYPQLARIVERSCRKAGVEYHVNPSVRSAIASHYRWLRQMGRNPANAAA